MVRLLFVYTWNMQIILCFPVKTPVSFQHFPIVRTKYGYILDTFCTSEVKGAIAGLYLFDFGIRGELGQLEKL